jgi:MFS family permease
MATEYLHRLHFPYLQFDQSKDMWLIDGLRIARELASKFVLFFLPLYLFQLGQTAQPFGSSFSLLQQGIFLLLLFYFLTHLATLVTSIFFGKLTAKIGPERAIVLSQVFFVIYFLLLYEAKNSIWLVLVAAVVNATQSLFWNSYHYLLSQNASRTRIGSDLGIISFLLHLVAIVAPLVGGWLVGWQGYQLLFLIGIMNVLVGLFFAIQLTPKVSAETMSWQEFMQWLSEAGYRKLASAYVGKMVNDTALELWPLYVFLLLGSVMQVGYIYALSLFLAMLVSYFAGRVIDKIRDRRSFFTSGGVLATVWLLRTQVSSIWSIVVIDACDKLTASFHWLFFDKQFIARSQGNKALAFFVYREIIIHFSAVIFWLLLAGYFWLFADVWMGLFVLAALGVGFSLLVREHRAD